MSGIDAFTKLLLHYDGSNGGTTFTDSSTSPKTIGRSNPVTTTATVKFGTAAGAYSSGYTYIANGVAGGDPDFIYGTADFTIDLWFYTTTLSGVQLIYESRGGAGGQQPLIYLNAGVPTWYANGAARITGSAVTANAWHHLAVARASSVTKMFIDGVQVGSSYTDGNSYVGDANRPLIGADNTGAANFFIGYLDEYRVSKGIARWTANFTPPTAPYSAATIVSGAGTATGTGAASAVGRSTAAGVGGAHGTGAASAVGRSTAAGVGGAHGTGAGVGIGGATIASTGTAVGTGSGSGAGTAVIPSTGSSSGDSTAAGVGTAVTEAIGISTGSGDAFGFTVTFHDDTEVICVHAENRLMSVEAENRAMAVIAEDRSMEVLVEPRAMAAGPAPRSLTTCMAVLFEDRSMKAGPRKRVC